MAVSMCVHQVSPSSKQRIWKLRYVCTRPSKPEHSLETLPKVKCFQEEQTNSPNMKLLLYIRFSTT